MERPKAPSLPDSVKGHWAERWAPAGLRPYLRLARIERPDRGRGGLRPAFLDRACQGDAELRAKLEELLQAHGEAGNFLQEPSAAPVATVDEDTLAAVQSGGASSR